MKKIVLIAILFSLVPLLHAQKYEMTFQLPAASDSILYLGQHYRDRFTPLDSAVRGPDNTYRFAGKRKFETGMYALFNKEAKKALFEFTIDGSQRFSVRTDSAFSVHNPKTDISGSHAMQQMYTYINRINQAKKQAKEIEQRKKSSEPKVKAQANEDMELLSKEIIEYENSTIRANQKYRFFHLLGMFKDPEVPESVEDKAVYFRTHYWDGVDFSDHSLVRTPDLFNKMNYYFFGILYRADFDTICRYADMVLHKIENDTLMLRYFMDYIMPRYYRSTKNIGWDATWCYLVRNYYLKGKCSWAPQSEITNKRQTCEFLEKSLIGARGAELFMADTNQSTNPQDWISSHRFPTRYVILWFWDPDCHHCQQQTPELKHLYDSLCAAGNKRFEVYAVGYDADIEKWKRYVRQYQLDWVNVGGTNVNIDYQEAYNVHGTPTMIILNEERRIIMNKVLPTKSILTFLDHYESLHPLPQHHQPAPPNR